MMSVKYRHSIGNPWIHPQLQNIQAPMTVSFIVLSIINLKAYKHFKIIEVLEQQKTSIIIPSYRCGLHPYVFPMGTPIMPMSINPMTSLLMSMWIDL